MGFLGCNLRERDTRQAMRGLLALGLGASPIVGGAVAAVIVLKLRKRRRNRQQGIDDDGNAGADEVRLHLLLGTRKIAYGLSAS